jgi:N-acetylmuramoyl-L-alanine amidase
MKTLLTINILLSIVFMACNSTESKNDKAKNITKEKSGKQGKSAKENPELSTVHTIPYVVNEDYITDEDYPHRNENEGISSIIFHYTAQSFKKSLRSLTTGGNSSHWLIPASGDTIYRIVNENRRAQHAGSSLWKNRKNMNVISVGIEIVNLGFKCKNNRKTCSKQTIEWLEFPEKQQKLIVSLAKDIQQRYNIDPLCVIGHADIAVDRKVDPGPLFPWKMLADNGIGAWATDEEISKEIKSIQDNIGNNISRLLVQLKLYEYGYDIRKDNVSNKSIENKLKKINYSLKHTAIDDYTSLNQINDYGFKKPNNNIFDDKKTNFAIEAFIMHYIPSLYLEHEKESKDEIVDNRSKHDTEHTPDSKSDMAAGNQGETDADNLKVLATIQALMQKYPAKVRMGCSY